MDKKEKIISFRADDSGVSSVIEKMRKAALSANQQILAEANKLASINKKITESIEEQIKSIERRSKVESLAKERALQNTYRSAISEQTLRKQISSIEQQRSVELEGVTGVVERSDINRFFDSKIRNLREDFASGTTKRRARDQYNSGMEDLRVEDKESNIAIQLLRELKDEIKNSALQQITENRKDVEKTIKAYEKGDLKNLSPEEEAKIRYQQELLNNNFSQGDKDKSRWSIGKEALGTFLGNQLSNIFNNFKSWLGNIPNASSGDEMVASMWTVLPVVGGFLGSAASRALQEGEQQKRAVRNLRAITGLGFNQSSLWGAEEFGYDVSEFAPLLSSIARNSGSNQDVYSKGLDILSYEKRFGLDQGNLLSMSQYLNSDRFTKALNASIGYNTYYNNGDNSNLGNVLEAMNSLLKNQSDTLVNVSEKMNATILGSFMRIGGPFGDYRIAQMIPSMNNALRNSPNEYAQALDFSTLANLNPSASYFDILKKQEMGLAAPGFLKGLFSNYNKMYGSGDMMKIAIMNRLGLSANQSDYLVNRFNEDSSIFDSIGDVDEFNNLINAVGGGRPGTKGYITNIEKSSARIQNAFGTGEMWVGLNEIIKESGNSVAESLKEVGGVLGIFGKAVEGVTNWIYNNTESRANMKENDLND